MAGESRQARRCFSVYSSAFRRPTRHLTGAWPPKGGTLNVRFTSQDFIFCPVFKEISRFEPSFPCYNPTMKHLRALWLPVLLNFFFPVLAQAQAPDETPVRWTAQSPRKPVQAGGQFEAAIEATIA